MGDNIVSQPSSVAWFQDPSWWTALGTIMGAVAACVGFIVAILQLRNLQAQIDSDLSWRKAEKTFDVATTYGRNIAPLISYLFDVLNISGSLSIIEHIDKRLIWDFNTEELGRIEDDLRRVGILKVASLKQAILDSLAEIPLAELRISHALLPHTYWKDTESFLNGDDEREYYIREFRHVVNDTVNELTSICIPLNNDKANDELLYTPVHSSFFLGMQLVYYEIAAKRKPGESGGGLDNLIETYQRWAAYEEEAGHQSFSVRHEKDASCTYRNNRQKPSQSMAKKLEG